MTYDNIKSHKNQGFALFLEDTIFEKPEWGSNWQTDMDIKITEIKGKIPSATGLVTTAALNTKVR